MRKLTRGFLAALGLLTITSSAKAQVTLYVDTQNGAAADTNPGTAALPYKTIGKGVAVALTNNLAATATTVLIAPGTYRESLSLPANGAATNAAITLQAQTVGTVIVSGSDVFTGWAIQGAGPLYTHAWPYDFGLAPYPPGWVSLGITLQDIVRRREQLFVNGTSLTQVLTAGALVLGSFYVDEVTNVITIWPPAGTNMGTALVEAAVRSVLFNAVSRNNLTVRGLVFQHDTTPVDGSAVILDGGTGDLFEDNRIVWNNWGGLSRSLGTDTTLRRNDVSDNGGRGIGSFKTKNLLMEDNETSTNNWRGFQGGFTGFAVSGMKILHLHTGVIRDHRAVGNFTNGVWFDTNCTNVTVTNAFIDRNVEHGVFVEANNGPLTIENSIICHNQDTAGILLANSSDTRLRNNILYGNADAQILVSGTDAPRSVTDWETGVTTLLFTDRMWMQYNTIVGLGTTTPGPLILSTTLTSAWDEFIDTLTTDCNLYWNPNRTNVWQITGAVLVDFAGWKATPADDSHSLFADPLFVDPANDNYQRQAGAPRPSCPGTARTTGGRGKLR